MSFFSEMFKGGTEGIFTGAGTLFKDIRTAITGDEPLTAEQKARFAEQTLAAEMVMEKAAADYQIAQLQGQMDINKLDASSGSNFRGGWRPATGWICAFGLGYTYILRPLLPWVLDVCGVADTPPLPPIDTQELMILLGGLLGLGGFRTYEKVKKNGN